MRISDWSSDVCSSDLDRLHPLRQQPRTARADPARTWQSARRAISRGLGGHRAADGDPRLLLWAEPHLLHHGARRAAPRAPRSEEHTSELQSLMRISYAVFCLKKKKPKKQHTNYLY